MHPTNSTKELSGNSGFRLWLRANSHWEKARVKGNGYGKGLTEQYQEPTDYWLLCHVRFSLGVNEPLKSSYVIYNQGSNSYWKTWKNKRSFSSQGILKFYQKVREFCMSQGKLDHENKKNVLWGKSKISCFQTYFCWSLNPHYEKHVHY